KVPLVIAAGLRLGFVRGGGKRAVPVGTAIVAAIVAVAGSSAALLYGASLQRMIDTPPARGWTVDVVARDPRSGRTLTADPEVRAVSQVRIATIAINARPVEVRGVKTLRGTDPQLVIRGRAPASDGEVALGAQTMQAMHVGLGETVHAVGPTGSRDLRVVGQALFAGVSDDPQLADGALVTESGLSRIYPDLRDDAPDAANDQSFTSYLVTFRDDVDKTAAAHALETQLQRLAGND